VVGDQPLQVAEQRPGDAEEADADDRHAEREDLGALGRAADQVAGGGELADRGKHRPGPERHAEHQFASPRRRRGEDAPQRGGAGDRSRAGGGGRGRPAHAATALSGAATIRPSRNSTTRSAPRTTASRWATISAVRLAASRPIAAATPASVAVSRW